MRAARQRRPERDGVRLPAPFVVGVPRSGTTLLRLMLDAHPDLAIPPETHFIPRLLRTIRGAENPTDSAIEMLSAHRRWPEFGVDPGELRARLAEQRQVDAATVLRAFYGLCAEHEGKPRWGDKTPWYVKKMRRIGSVLEEARFVHVIRDGRDVALSTLDAPWGPDTLWEAAELWVETLRRGRRQGRELGEERYLEVRYEDLASDPEATLRGVASFLALDWDPGMLHHHERSGERLGEDRHDLTRAGAEPLSREERARAHSLTREPAMASRVGRWRSEMSEADRAAFERLGGPTLAELGYESG